jgi:hypothetical protein
MRSLVAACAFAMIAGACSSDAPVLLDALPDSSVDRCLVPGSYGTLGALTGAADVTAPSSLSITLDDGPPRDVLFVQLVDGKGVFTGGGLMTGTFALRGPDTSLIACGLCTSIVADIVTGRGPTKFFFADAGTVTLTSTSPITGSAQDLHFVEIDGGTGAAVPGGCTATIAQVSFGP